jgi:lipopolysaccharide/colanic/teichoic acid biosynthesis glycosyltransferase
MPDTITSPWVTTFSSTHLPSVSDRPSSTPSGRHSRGHATLGLSPARRLKPHAGPRRLRGRYRAGAIDRVVRRATGGPILAAAIFRSALVRERRRADRSKEPFALLSFDLSPAGAPRVTAALTALSSEHCLVGWMEDGRQLGVIATDLHVDADARVQRLADAIRAAVADVLGPEAVAALRVSTYLHTGPIAIGAPGLQETDPLIEDLRTAEAGRLLFAFVKRAIDVLGSLICLVLFSPVLLVVAILVKATSPGPVFFRQARVGLRARSFPMLKFRTMQAGNDPAIHQKFVTAFIDAGNAEDVKTEDTPFKIKADPRITSIGRALRRTSIDELPQLWNVLRGEMSLVGPRPPIDYELARYQPWHWRRVLEAKPGMTGLWQVAGRSQTSFDGMVRLDVAYARSRSIRLDLWILLHTPRAVITGKGAY